MRELKNGSDEILVLRCTLDEEEGGTSGLRDKESANVVPLPEVTVASEILRMCASRSSGRAAFCMAPRCLRMMHTNKIMKTIIATRPPITPPMMAPVGEELEEELDCDVGAERSG
jgi:hypothetical protein